MGTLIFGPIFRDSGRNCSAVSCGGVSYQLNSGRSFGGVYGALRSGNVEVVLSNIFGRIKESFFTFGSIRRGHRGSECTS